MSTTNAMVTYVGGTSWTRNTDCIVQSSTGYDTTGISTGVLGYGGIGATLISNRHVLMAMHTTGFTLPQTLYFVNNSNTTFTYTITALSMVGPYGPGYTDIAVGYLNTTIDASLSYYKVFPQNWLDYVQYTNPYGTNYLFNPKIPMFYMDQEKKFLCGDLASINISDPSAYFAFPYFSTDTERFNNSEVVVGGDSGNIIFSPVQNEIVLLGMWYTSGQPKVAGNYIGQASYIPSQISAINSVMTSLAGTSYSLSEFDMSVYYNY